MSPASILSGTGRRLHQLDKAPTEKELLMARVKRAVHAKKHHRAVLEQAFVPRRQ
jgi:hypothetical protein